MSELITHWYSGGRAPTQVAKLRNIAAKAVAKEIDMRMQFTSSAEPNTFTTENPSLYHHVMTDPELRDVMQAARGNSMHRDRIQSERYSNDKWWHEQLGQALVDTGTQIEHGVQLADVHRI